MGFEADDRQNHSGRQATTATCIVRGAGGRPLTCRRSRQGNRRGRLVAAVLGALLLLASSVPAAATPLFQVEESPARLAQEMQSALFDAQTALLAGDEAAAVAGVDAASATLASLLPRFTTDPEVGPAVEAGLERATTAAARGDPRALSVAHGQIWASLVRGALSETIAAAQAGDADDAASWLLLRDFRPTTRFARPNADATLAVRGLQSGALAADDAVAIVQADLLDTYQSRLESTLNSIAGTPPDELTFGQTYEVGLAAGYWQILAPAYATQFGAEARADADAVFMDLLESVASAAAGDNAATVDDATAIVQSFRAAPLSDDDLARRSGQLLRYLSLVAVEYGRGVKDGEVLLEFEIVEAQAFLDGARAAFADLRLPLRAINAGEAAAIEQVLDTLQEQLDTAIARTDVTDPARISQETDEAERRLSALYPSAWTAGGRDADFDVVDSLLEQVVAAASAGEYQQADAARIEAYAIFETGPEKRLLAFAPEAVQRVEQLFWDGTGTTPGLRSLLVSRADAAAIQGTAAALESELREAQAVLSGGTAPAAIIFNAATIVFREGLEAVLILASLLASMVGANRRFKRPLAIGAIGAFVATIALFILARGALLSFQQYGEQIEAIVSVIAIGVLLLVMNWFFHKVYWTRWIAGHHDRRRRIILGGVAGQTLGLVLLGFSSVFREGAETVLFLQALVLDAGTWIVIQGTLLGLIATAVIGVLTLVLQTKLPHKKMLIVTGVMIAFVLVTMVGGTVHTLQLVGWLPIHPIPGLSQLPYWLGVWFGLFPSWEGVIAQALALTFVVGSYYVAEQAQQRDRGAALAPAAGPANAR